MPISSSLPRGTTDDGPGAALIRGQSDALMELAQGVDFNFPKGKHDDSEEEAEGGQDVTIPQSQQHLAPASSQPHGHRLYRHILVVYF